MKRKLRVHSRSAHRFLILQKLDRFSCPGMWVQTHTLESLRLLRRRHLERGGQEAETASARLGYLLDPLVPANHRIEIAWSRCINLKPILASPKLPRSLRLRSLKASIMSALFYGCESWKLTIHVQRKLNNTASKTLSRIMGRSIAEEARIPSADILLNMRDRRWSWLGHVSRMDHDILVRITSELRQAGEGIIMWWHSQRKCRESHRNCAR